MDKNWLIRTKSNHILGPISKEKVLELYHNGSIKPDDEVCCGNGYWFFIREDDMVERFLKGSEIQGFNPISEAKDVLTSGQPRAEAQTKDDITMIGGLNLSMLKQQVNATAGVPPVPDMPAPVHKSSTPKEPVSTETKKKNNLDQRPKASQGSRQSKPLKKQSYLKYIGILGFLALFLLIYFRQSIINYLFEGEITAHSISIMSVAHAQEDLPEKKKSF